MNPPFPLKSLFLILCALAATPAWSQAPAAAPAAKALPEPLPSTSADNTRYINKPALLVGCTSRVEAIQGKPCDLIFIGDSITEGWVGTRGKEVWEKHYGQRNALDFGIGGDKTQNVLWRLQTMNVKGLRPKVAVILIGTNNLRNTPQEIADGVKAVITETQGTFPGVKVILVSIMPNKRANDKMMDTDGIIRTYADGKAVTYLDLVPLMPPVGDNWAGLGADHLHPDAKGYEIWADALDPVINSLMASN